MLLLANTKAAFEALRQRIVTHRNFVRADANLKRRFRTAEADELAKVRARVRVGVRVGVGVGVGVRA